MIALDYTVFIQIVAFLFFWFLLTRLLIRPFLGLLAERERRTEGVKSEAALLKEEGERLGKEYELGITKAQGEAKALKESVVQEARETRDRLIAQAREEAAGMLEAVREEIRKELQRGRGDAAREAEVIAHQMAEKILGRKIG
ncbi:MAG: hypothetical protein A2W73_03205 [Deltaproteobacteria bacterium RIFCSPLOWO2_12_55_13]|nr:MAG: hypothetical protein A2W73_03205 [Deltaproteobacteria bacterium RIFCSPLOWO2_12_55_13]